MKVDDGKKKLRKEILSLHAEMEVAQYGTNIKGQFRRKCPRSLAKKRTVKRKALEKADAIESETRVVDDDIVLDGAIGGSGNSIRGVTGGGVDGSGGGTGVRPVRKRLRGSRVAFNDEVVKETVFFRDFDLRHEGSSVNVIENENSKNIDNDKFKDNTNNEKDNSDNNAENDTNDAEKRALEIDDDIGEKELSQHDNNSSDEIDDNDDDEKGRYEMYANEMNASSSDNMEDEEEDEEEKEEIEKGGVGKEGKDLSESEVGGKSGGNNRIRLPRRRQQPQDISTTIEPHQSEKIRSVNEKYKGKHIARLVYRLQNFKSHRLAKRHGDALGAYATGKNATAVRRLGEVAGAVPVAPQLYSSLGLVYESMLRNGEDESRDGDGGKGREEVDGQNDDNVNNNDKKNNCDSNDDINDNKRILSRLSLAKKVFGSYHVAALLCKKDHSLWVRSGDAALLVAELYTTLGENCNRREGEIVTNENNNVTDDNCGSSSGGGGDSNDKKRDASRSNNETTISTDTTNIEEHRAHHRERQKFWLNEAKNDYLVADQLKPPGITVPSKLANVQMMLGSLSEALSILTDLKNNAHRNVVSKPLKGKNKGGSQGQEQTANMKGGEEDDEVDMTWVAQRSELEGSYAVWMLYSDLMIKVGYECITWNRGVYTNNNYMFKRWLRKYSSSFDWRERRLQALCMAMEAATGSKSTEQLMKWARRRAGTIAATVTKTSTSGDCSPSNNIDDKVHLDDRREEKVASVLQLVDSYEQDHRAHLEKDEASQKNEENNATTAMCTDKNDEVSQITATGSIVEEIEIAVESEEKGNNATTATSATTATIATCTHKNDEVSQTTATGPIAEEIEIAVEREEKLPKISIQSSNNEASRDVEKSSKLSLESNINYLIDDLTVALNRDRDILLALNKKELDTFDQDTLKMNIVSQSQAAVERSDLRKLVKKNHSTSVVDLVGDYRLNKIALEDSSNIQDEKPKSKTCPTLLPLPITAPCSAVHNIALQLMKQCLGLELYHGGKLVAEAVSSYYRERAVKQEKKLQKIRFFEEQQKILIQTPVQLRKEKYDDVGANLFIDFISIFSEQRCHDAITLNLILLSSPYL